MSTYKLIYFNVTGLGESLRFLLNYAGISFEDKRINFDEWPKYKSEMPMGQMPVLEIDGQKYNQSKAIGRYLAKKCNLYGASPIEAMEIDAAVENIDDMRQALSQYYWEQDPALQAKLKDVAYKKMEFSLDKLEEQVKKNGGHFVGGKLTWADIVYAGFNDYLSHVVGGDFNKNHPELGKLVKKVYAIPSIQAYLAKRPKTDL